MSPTCFVLRSESERLVTCRSRRRVLKSATTPLNSLLHSLTRRAYATRMAFSAHAKGIVTVDQFLESRAATARSELVRGLVPMTPTGGAHGAARDVFEGLAR
jgi:hypothetical protein